MPTNEYLYADQGVITSRTSGCNLFDRGHGGVDVVGAYHRHTVAEQIRMVTHRPGQFLVRLPGQFSRGLGVDVVLRIDVHHRDDLPYIMWLRRAANCGRNACAHASIFVMATPIIGIDADCTWHGFLRCFRCRPINRADNMRRRRAACLPSAVLIGWQGSSVSRTGRAGVFGSRMAHIHGDSCAFMRFLRFRNRLLFKGSSREDRYSRERTTGIEPA